MLTFDVHGQTLIRTDNFEPATDSVNYLMAQFSYKTSEWRTGNTKTALFRLGETVYPAILDAEGTCIVPWEALVHGDSQYARKNGSTVFVSLKAEQGTTRITTDEVAVKLKSSGYGDTETPEEPTDGVYEQVMTAFGEMQTKVDTTMKTVANAVKGVRTGAVVGVGDMSPLNHNFTVKVGSRNLLNPAKFLSGNSTTSRTYMDDVLTVTGYYVSQVLEDLTVGKTYTLSFSSTRTGTTGGGVAVEFRDADNNNLLGYYHTSALSKTLTFTVPEGTHHLGIYLYGSNSTSGTTSATYTELLLVEGDTAIDYTPYVDPATVQVRMYGKNLLDIERKSETINGVTFTVNDDGGVKAVGTPTGVITKFLAVNFPGMVKGEKYVLTGCPTGGDTSTYSLRFIGTGDSTYTEVHDEGAGVEFEFLGYDSQYSVAICIHTGAVMNHTFYPMMRHASIEDDTFEVYSPLAVGNPGADGAITTSSANVSSVSALTVLTWTEGALLEVEYNRDINAALDDKADRGAVIVNMTLDSGKITVIDKTFAETLAAFLAGRLIECRVDAGRDGYYVLSPVRVYGADGIVFAGHSGNTGTVWTTVTFLDNDTATFITS